MQTSISRDACFYPFSLFDELLEPGAALGDDRHRRWQVLYTKSRQEKFVARSLLGNNVPFYLPLVKKTNIYKRSRKTVHVPLFSGYVFLYGDEEERLCGLKTNRISRILDVPDGDRLVNDLRGIHRILTSGEPVTPEERVQPGRRVRIRSGPLSGMEGTVLARNKQLRIVVSVDFLQRGASVEIEDGTFETVT